MKPHTSSKKATAKTGTILQIKVCLLETHIPIWRRFLIPASFNLQQLHEVLQVVMGWKNSHLYRFEIDGQEYGIHEPEFEDEKKIMKAHHHTLSDITSTTMQFTYCYDFGDNWQHEVLIEKPLSGMRIIIILSALEEKTHARPKTATVLAVMKSYWNIWLTRTMKIILPQKDGLEASLIRTRLIPIESTTIICGLSNASL